MEFSNSLKISFLCVLIKSIFKRSHFKIKIAQQARYLNIFNYISSEISCMVSHSCSLTVAPLLPEGNAEGLLRAMPLWSMSSFKENYIKNILKMGRGSSPRPHQWQSSPGSKSVHGWCRVQFPIALGDLALPNFSWFSPKLA